MANRYWVGGSGTWDASSTTHWSATSGGGSGASVPTSSDSVFFDQAGTYTVTLGTGANLSCLDWTVSAGTVTFAGTPNTWSLYGSISLIAGTVVSFTLTASGFILYGVNKTIQTNGVTLSNTGFNLRGAGTYTLLGALTCTQVYINPSSSIASPTILALGGYTLTLTSASSTTCQIYDNSGVNFGSGGIIVLTGSTGGFNVTSAGNTIYISGTGTLQFNGTSNALTGQGKTFPGVTLSKGGTGTLNITTSITVDTIQNTTQPVTFNFTSGTTTTVTNFNASGTAGNLVTLKASTAGSQFSIAKASGTVTANYLSIKDSAATGGASWNANNSTDAGNNSGWVINGGTSAVTVIPTNTNISGTAAINSVTFVGDITVSVANTNINGTTSLNNSGVIVSTGTGVLAPVTTVYGTTSLRPITVAIVQNATATVTGVSATGAISTYPLNIWISVVTTQTPTWTSIIT